MTTLRTVVLFVAVVASTAPDAGADMALGGDSAALHSDTLPTPMIWSFKGGFQSALNLQWREPTGKQAGSRFTSAGLTIEADDLRRFIAGAGAEFAWSSWSAGDEYRGPISQHMYALFLYGTIGYSVWKRVDGRARIWGSFDIGRIWCGEEVTTPGFGNSDDVSGTAARIRASYLRHLCGTVAFGVTGGWQWAEPRLQSGFSSAGNSTPRVNLSGPLIAAHIALVSPLGKSSCSH